MGKIQQVSEFEPFVGIQLQQGRLIFIYSIEIKVFLYSLYCNIINPIDKNMGACIASGMCCCFTMCCKECSESLQKLMGRERVTKFFYFFLVVVYTIPALLVFFLLDKWKSFVEYFDEWIKCPASSGGSSYLMPSM